MGLYKILAGRKIEQQKILLFASFTNVGQKSEFVTCS